MTLTRPAGLAGPVEFSTGDIIAILAIMAALFLAIPTLVGLALMFRHRVTTAHPTRSSSARHFFIGLIVAAFVQGAVIAVANALQN